ncbi:MAG: signal peptide peptidase SppA [Candidatus Edwardsbacteria bacterium]|jgi:protease-4|nr:signal peptide peptidase SppA [Candidatus Edwardsbacteria bacterium]
MASGRKTLFIVLIALALLGTFAALGVAVLFSLGDSDHDLSYGKSVAVVEVRGVIDVPDGIVRSLNRCRDNSSVKAVVLRVDSPGGGVAASQEIWQAVKRVREKKPVVCSMAEVAASGGYYVACACDSIVANPGSLTGSIGVIMEFPVAEELLRKVGLRFEVLKAGENKDIGSPFRQMRPAERAMLQEMIDDIHQQFIGAVAEGRGIPADSVRLLADGRVFSGKQALALRLVDTLGTLDDAIDLAGRMGGIAGRPRVTRERRRTINVLDLLAASSEALSRLERAGTRLQYRMAP